MRSFQIHKQNVHALLETKYIKVFDLQYEKGAHYYNATRRAKEDIVAIKSDAEFNAMLPDAVSCFLEIHIADEEPRLLMFYEYRYPIGQFMLSVPSGLIDPGDRDTKDPIISAAIREVKEETGITMQNEQLEIINALAFTTPGMTDESTALVRAVVRLTDCSELNHHGARGSEQFDGFYLATPSQVKAMLAQGKDPHGHAYPLMSWCAMMDFVSRKRCGASI